MLSLKYLRTLICNCCNISIIPSNIAELKTLQQIYLINNKLEDIDNLTKCKELIKIRVSRNQLTSYILPKYTNTRLPFSILDSTKLKELDIDENPIVNPPEDIWKNGLDNILNSAHSDVASLKSSYIDAQKSNEDSTLINIMVNIHTNDLLARFKHKVEVLAQYQEKR